MRLINPGPGEYLDRKTILDLKIAAARQRGIEHLHFDREWSACMERLEAYRKLHSDKWDGWERSLADVNRLVWDAIDEQRLAEKEGDEAAEAQWGRTALHGNDLRGKLIHEVNRHFGALQGAEKIAP